MKLVAVLFLMAGFFFTLVAAIGVVRLPDFYTRLHAAGKGDTLGLALSLVGLAIYQGFSLTSMKLIMIVILVFIANPIGTHVLCRAAYKSGVKPWTREGDKNA